MSADRDQLRLQLAEVLAGRLVTVEVHRGVVRERVATPRHLAALLLPVVEAHTRTARADELDALADADLPADQSMRSLARDRAAALRTHEGVTDGQ